MATTNNNARRSWLDFFKEKIRKYRKAAWIASPSKSVLKLASLLNYGLYAAATTFSVIKALTDFPPNSLTNIGMILAGASSIVQFGTKHIAAVQNYNEAEDITTVNYAGNNPYMFNGTVYLLSQFIQFGTMSVVLVSSGAAITNINEKHKFYLSMQLIANAASILYSEFLAHCYIAHQLKKTKENAILTPAQQEAYRYSNFHFWNARGFNVLGKTLEQTANIESDIIRNYINIGLLSVKKASKLSENHRNLLALERFIAWFGSTPQGKKKKELKKIIDIAGSNINPINLNNNVLWNLVSNRELPHNIPLSIAIQLQEHHRRFLRNEQSRGYIISGQLSAKNFLAMEENDGVDQYMADHSSNRRNCQIM